MNLLTTLTVDRKNGKPYQLDLPDYIFVPSQDELEGLIEKEIGNEALQFVKKHIPVNEQNMFVSATATRFNIITLTDGKYKNILNMKRVNDFRYVNKFFEAVNHKLPLGGCFVDFVDTYATRRVRILNNFKKPFNWFYYVGDVVFFRIFPKLPVLKKLYFFITKGKNRVLTRAETFGRLYSCGFEIVDEALINNKVFFIARKIKEPAYDMKPTYGPIARLKRVGKGGRIFNVYKLRTMHAYSEYLQAYMYENSQLQEGGKFKNDFRVSSEGKFFRKFWLDELPMLVNLLKGDMKLVGVRPLSRQFFSLYTDELQQKRIQFKPGLLPPFYADSPGTLKEIMASEMRYLEAYEKHPLRTDIAYFFRIWYNILFNGKRSG